jgi:hypothetical protein
MNSLFSNSRSPPIGGLETMATNLGQNSATSKARGSGKIRGSPRTRKRGERERREKERTGADPKTFRRTE